MARRGRGKRITTADVADIRALVANGYWRSSVATLFGITLRSVQKAVRGPLPEAVLPVMSELRPAWRLNWAQRVIWAG